MEDLREQQLEALTVVSEYIGKLVPNMKTVSGELRNGRLEDTEEFLNQILNGMNWCIEVFNGTRDLVNEKQERINKNAINEKILELGEALKGKDDKKTADLLETAVVPFLNDLKAAADEITAA